MHDPLELGRWFNNSRHILLFSAIVTAVSFIAFCLATWFFVAQYFVCIDQCKATPAPLLLVAVSAFFGLIPASLTGVMGYFIVRGLVDDARAKAPEAGMTVPAGTTREVGNRAA